MRIRCSSRSLLLSYLKWRIIPIVSLFYLSSSLLHAYQNGFFLQIPFHFSPTIIVITPTYPRNERLADMTRLSQTLSHISNLHWIVIEDDNSTSPLVERILQRSRLPYVYLSTTTPKGLPRRGWSHRDLALAYIRDTYKGKRGVVYFADDDNSYDVRLFDQYIRKVKRIGVWAVGLAGSAFVEAPRVSKGKIVGWDVIFAPKREFATDMAGFAINLKEVLRTNVTFIGSCLAYSNAGVESCFLSQFRFKKEQLEPFGYADHPKEVLVWHTRTSQIAMRGSNNGYDVEQVLVRTADKKPNKPISKKTNKTMKH